VGEFEVATGVPDVFFGFREDTNVVYVAEIAFPLRDWLIKVLQHALSYQPRWKRPLWNAMPMVDWNLV
jgi:hypothetical protein